MVLRKISIRNRGFSLIELLVIMGLISLVAGFGLIVSMDDYRGYNFRSERDVVVSTLQKARSQAVSNMCYGSGCTDGKQHGVYFGTPGHYIIFQGASYTAGDPTNEDIAAKNAAASVSGITSVVFTQLSGTAVTIPASPSTLTVVDTGGHTSVVTIEASGRIWWSN